MNQDRIKANIEHNIAVADMFNDLPPFTVTIDNGRDAAFLSSALMLWMASGDNAWAEGSVRLMVEGARNVGVEKCVNTFFDEGEKRGIIFPKFMKPLFIHMISHIVKDKP